MKIITADILNDTQKIGVYDLWNSEYPKQICYKNTAAFDEYLQQLQSQKHYLLQNGANKIVAWSTEFRRENETWFAIIVDSHQQKKGYGTMLLNVLKANNEKLNGWVVDHQNDFKSDGTPYQAPIDFYLKNQFLVETNTRFENDLLSLAKITWQKNS